MPAPIRDSLIRHPIRAIEARTAGNFAARKLGAMMKLIAPVLTSGTFAGLFLGSPGAATITNLLFYVLLGAGSGTLVSRGLSKSFRIAKAERESREARSAAGELNDKLNNMKTEFGRLEGRVAELQRSRGSMIDRLRELGIDPSELEEVPFDGHNVFKGKLGAGGMAIAILVRNLDLDAFKVFKIPRPDLLGNPVALARFKGGEAKSMLELNHSNIVRFFTLGHLTKDGYLELVRQAEIEEYESLRGQVDNLPASIPYIEMEYVEGRTLADRLNNTLISPRQAVKLAIDMANTLWYVSHKGIIHRDLKPENIFLVRDEYNPEEVTIKIGDFGLAKLTEMDKRQSVQLTQMGEVFGTPQYMSPEQWRGEKVDWRTDQYALGVILFEMMTGQFPYATNEELDRLAAGHQYGSLVLAGNGTSHRRDIRRIFQVPERLAVVLDRMLAFDPAQRFPSWQECVEALQNVFSQESSIEQDATAIASVVDGQVVRKG